MNTTSLFVDLLISGIQVAIWLCLLLASFVGADPAALRELKGWELPIAVVLLSIVYPAGIFIDNLADEVLKVVVGRRIRRRFGLREGDSVTNLLELKRNESLSKLLEYQRTRIRICRSSLFNFALITLSGELFVWWQWRPAFGVSQPLLAWLIAVSGVVLTALAGLSWYLITVSFTRKVASEFSGLAGRRAGDGPPPSRLDAVPLVA